MFNSLLGGRERSRGALVVISDEFVNEIKSKFPAGTMLWRNDQKGMYGAATGKVIRPLKPRTETDLGVCVDGIRELGSQEDLNGGVWPQAEIIIMTPEERELHLKV